MIEDERKAITRRAVEEIWNGRSLSAVYDFFPPDFSEAVPNFGLPPTREGMKLWVSMVLSAFPDMRFTIEEQVAEGDRVVTRWIARGTHRAEFLGLPATGRKVVLEGVTFARVSGGKVTERRAFWDRLSLIQQLGANPESLEMREGTGIL